MQRTLVAGRKNHCAKREVSRLEDVWVIVLAGSPAADISHLRAFVFRIHLGLEIKDAPVLLPVFEAGNKFIDVIDVRSFHIYCLKTVGAVYDRAYFVHSRKSARSQGL